MRTFRIVSKLGLLMAALFVVGCAQTQSHQTTAKAVTRDADPSVLLMPADILLQELTAGGQFNTNAAWTKAGESNVTQAIDQVLQNRGVELIRYASADADPEIVIAERHQQVVKLHEAVGSTILVHKSGNWPLPTKEGRFDWTLSEEVALLRNEYGADYALFVFMRDSFSSGGRTALIVAAALFGVGVSGGHQFGFASLVDLNSGDIVWFNRLAAGSGDLRDPGSARDSVENLLAAFPL
jgi:hypothetical protein